MPYAVFQCPCVHFSNQPTKIRIFLYIRNSVYILCNGSVLPQTISLSAGTWRGAGTHRDLKYAVETIGSTAYSPFIACSLPCNS